MGARKSMQVVINSTNFQRDFRAIAQKVNAGLNHYVVKISGLEVMAVIPIDEYKEFMKAREKAEQEEQEREKRIKRFERAARTIGEQFEEAGLTEEEVMVQLEKVKKDVYQKHYGRNQT
ncbi:MAG: hypothetical protein ACYDBJ_29285 [Aggregatilineales bacterium]